MQNDPVNHPSHYQSSGIECIEAMRFEYHPYDVAAFCLLNAFKYLWRKGEKQGNSEAQDISKAQWYIDKYNSLTNPTEPITIEKLLTRINKYKNTYNNADQRSTQNRS